MDKRLRAFLDGLSSLDVSQLLGIAAVHRGQDATSLESARSHARRAVGSLGRRDDVDRLTGQIVQWAGADGARSGVQTFTSPSRDLVLADARAQAAPALLDAAVGLLVEASLDPESAEALTVAWRIGAEREERSRDIRKR